MVYTLISGNPLAVERNLNKLAKEHSDHKVVLMTVNGGSTSVLVTSAKAFEVINQRTENQKNRVAKRDEAKLVRIKAAKAKLALEESKLNKPEGGV